MPRSIKKYIRDFILKLAVISGLNTIYGYFNKEKLVILWYHGVCEEDFTLLKGYDERHVPVSVFEKQLKYLKKKGYYFLNMTEVANILSNKGQISDRLVCLTFGDGFENVVKNAYPLIQKYGAKGCFYIIPSLIGTKELLWTDLVDVVLWQNNKGHFTFKFGEKDINYKTTSRKEIIAAIKDIKEKLRSVSNEEHLELLKQFQRVRLKDVPEDFSISNWEQVKYLDPHILEIGSHSLTHPNLDRLDTETKTQKEISLPKNLIEEELQRSVNHFSYPAGAFNNNIKSVVRKAGYTTGVSIIPGLNDYKTDIFELRRIGVTSNMTRFKTAITGFEDGLSRFYRLLNLFRITHTSFWRLSKLRRQAQ